MTMTSQPLFRTDPYAQSATVRVESHTAEGGIVVSPELFYPQAGGQPGDSGWLAFAGQRIAIATTLKGEDDRAVLVPAEAQALPPVGAEAELALDWERRYGHMRVHTALHLLSVVIPLPVSGGQIGQDKGRLDFVMPEPPTSLEPLEEALNALIARDLPVTTTWITDAELEANPSLVKTMSVRPPMGQGQVRLVRIGTPETQVDLQPCGGTHVARTAEIGRIRLTKVENKGRQNRRVHLHLES